MRRSASERNPRLISARLCRVREKRDQVRIVVLHVADARIHPFARPSIARRLRPSSLAIHAATPPSGHRRQSTSSSYGVQTGGLIPGAIERVGEVNLIERTSPSSRSSLAVSEGPGMRQDSSAAELRLAILAGLAGRRFNLRLCSKKPSRQSEEALATRYRNAAQLLLQCNTRRHCPAL